MSITREYAWLHILKKWCTSGANVVTYPGIIWSAYNIVNRLYKLLNFRYQFNKKHDGKKVGLVTGGFAIITDKDIQDSRSVNHNSKECSRIII